MSLSKDLARWRARRCILVSSVIWVFASIMCPSYHRQTSACPNPPTAFASDLPLFHGRVCSNNHNRTIVAGNRNTFPRSQSSARSLNSQQKRKEDARLSPVLYTAPQSTKRRSPLREKLPPDIVEPKWSGRPLGALRDVAPPSRPPTFLFPQCRLRLPLGRSCYR